MAIINNTSIKRGDKLKSTELNAEFTAVNTAFTMDDENFRNEALDQPAFDTESTTGAAGIILKSANTYDIRSGTLTVQANTNAETIAPVAATEVGAQAIVMVAKQNDIFRCYWQYDFNTEGDNTNAPIDIDRQGLCWAVWLEWKTSSGGSYTPVPGQGDLNDAITVAAGTRYGNSSSSLKATSLDYHRIGIRSQTYNQSIYPGRRGGYGQYYYKFTSDTTIYGLRLMVNGIYEPVFATSSSQNALKSTQAAGTAHKILIYDANISYLLMRNE